MKWLAITLVGCVLVSAWARTVPAAPGHDAVASLGAAERGARATLRALTEADEAYREYMRADSLLPLLPSAPGVTVSLPDALPAETRDSVHAAVQREVAEMDEPRARLGVFLLDHRYGQRADRSGAAFQREIYVGNDSAGPYCAMVATAPVVRGVLHNSGFGVGPRGPGQWSNRSASVLGPCAFVAAYGAPGAGVAQWLRTGGYQFAGLRGAAAEHAALREASGQIWLYTQADLWMRGCRGGRAELCTRVALQPLASDGKTEGAASFDLRRFADIDRGDRIMLHQLEQRYGTEQFARFWTSDADVQAAFASAFDMDMGDWMQEWSRSRYGATPLGARVDALSLLLSALTIAGFAGIAGVVTRRRRVS